MEILSWEKIKSSFQIDGSLRDIYIKGTNLDDWQIFLDYINTENLDAIFKINGEQNEYPHSISEIFLIQERATPTLTFCLDKSIQVNCHFFLTKTDTDPIELDISPKEIQSEESFNLLWTFISSFGSKLGKNIDLTFENSREEIIASYKVK